MTVMLLTKHHLEFISLKRGCTGSPKSTLVKIPHLWKSHVVAHLVTLCRLMTNMTMSHIYGNILNFACMSKT